MDNNMPNVREYLVTLNYDSSKSLSYQYVRRMPFMTEDGDIDVESKTDILYSNEMITDEDIAHLEDIMYSDNKKIIARNSVDHNPLYFSLYEVNNGMYCLHNYKIKSWMRNAGGCKRSYIDRNIIIKEPIVSIKYNRVIDHTINHELILDGHTYKYEDHGYKIYLISCAFTLLCMHDDPDKEGIKNILDAMVDKYGFKGYTVDLVNRSAVRLFEMGE